MKFRGRRHVDINLSQAGVDQKARSGITRQVAPRRPVGDPKVTNVRSAVHLNDYDDLPQPGEPFVIGPFDEVVAKVAAEVTLARIREHHEQRRSRLRPLRNLIGGRQGGAG